MPHGAGNLAGGGNADGPPARLRDEDWARALRGPLQQLIDGVSGPAGALLHLPAIAVAEVRPAGVRDSGVKRGHEGGQAGGGVVLGLAGVTLGGVAVPKGHARIPDALCPQAAKSEAGAEAVDVPEDVCVAALQGLDLGRENLEPVGVGVGGVLPLERVP